MAGSRLSGHAGQAFEATASFAMPGSSRRFRVPSRNLEAAWSQNMATAGLANSGPFKKPGHVAVSGKRGSRLHSLLGNSRPASPPAAGPTFQWRHASNLLHALWE